MDTARIVNGRNRKVGAILVTPKPQRNLTNGRNKSLKAKVDAKPRQGVQSFLPPPFRGPTSLSLEGLGPHGRELDLYILTSPLPDSKCHRGGKHQELCKLGVSQPLNLFDNFLVL